MPYICNVYQTRHCMQHISAQEQGAIRLADLRDNWQEIKQLPVAFPLGADGLDCIQVTRRTLRHYNERSPLCDYYYVAVDPVTEQPVKVGNVYTNLAGISKIDWFDVDGRLEPGVEPTLGHTN